MSVLCVFPLAQKNKELQKKSLHVVTTSNYHNSVSQCAFVEKGTALPSYYDNLSILVMLTISKDIGLLKASLNYKLEQNPVTMKAQPFARAFQRTCKLFSTGAKTNMDSVECD